MLGQTEVEVGESGLVRIGPQVFVGDTETAAQDVVVNQQPALQELAVGGMLPYATMLRPAARERAAASRSGSAGPL